MALRERVSQEVLDSENWPIPYNAAKAHGVPPKPWPAGREAASQNAPGFRSAEDFLENLRESGSGKETAGAFTAASDVEK
ncbi:MAG: hypothetical protein HC897_01305 [Thermoanaerobaculia bacterium]|nr:hypothetical protein [Thermoanaerobaculia bacterium]